VHVAQCGRPQRWQFVNAQTSCSHAGGGGGDAMVARGGESGSHGEQQRM
jgi:hypothetical protein